MGEDLAETVEEDEADLRQDDEDTDGGEDHGRYEEDTESETVSELPRLRTQFRSIRDRKPGGLNVGLLRNAFLLIDQDSIDSLITNPAALAWVWAVGLEYSGDLALTTKKGVSRGISRLSTCASAAGGQQLLKCAAPTRKMTCRCQCYGRRRSRVTIMLLCPLI